MQHAIISRNNLQGGPKSQQNLISSEPPTRPIVTQALVHATQRNKIIQVLKCPKSERML